MPKPPPLPSDWPFVARGAGPGAPVAELAELPGFFGEWHACSVSPPPVFDGHAPLEGSFGRGGIVLSGEYVLRPYRRGGLVRYVNRGTYLSPKRFKSEFDIHAALWEAGFPTVEPLGYAYRRHLLGFEGIYITRRAAGSAWPSAWRGMEPNAQNGREIGAKAAALVKSIASWGLWAPDLNATNFLVAPDGSILALDWDRARWVPGLAGPGLVKKYWVRLKRSLHKLCAPSALIDSLGDEFDG